MRFLPVRVFLLALLALGAAGASAQGTAAAMDDTQRVWDLLDARDQLQGRFRQALYDEEGELVERSEGRYAILRPGFFRWEIEVPDRQVITIADGILWHYDLDLATATQRRVDASEQFTALDLLARDGEDLARRFRVEAAGEGSYRLVPLFPQAGFSAVELTWRDDELAAMKVWRRGGQTLTLDLSADPESAALSPSDFAFEPPPGVDVQRAGGP